MSKRLLITGATGMLGATLVKHFQKEYEVFSTGSSEKGLRFFKNYTSFDLKEPSYEALIKWSKPNVIIHCAALTNGNYCDLNPKEAFLINGISVKKIIDAVNLDTKVIYISTDAVFPAELHMSKEEDCASPNSVYGKSKELGEFFLTNSKLNYTIIRTTIVGSNLNKTKSGFAEWILNSVKNKEEISLFADVLFTPISIWNLAENINQIISNNEMFSRKTLHIGGNEICTKYDFGIALLKQFNLPVNLIKKGKITDFKDRAKRSTDQTLDSSYYQNLSKTVLPNLHQTIKDFKINYNE